MDKEIKRLKRFIKISWALLLLFVVALVAYFSYQVGTLKRELALVSNTQPTVIQGINGQNGLQGIQGVAGINGKDGAPGKSGKDGKSVTASQIASAVSTYLTLHPVKTVAGAQGEAGKDGVTPVLKVDTSTCSLQTQLSGDDGWSVLAQLPKPCEVTK